MAAAGIPSLSKAQIAAVAAGNALEFYDFLTYTFFAVQIGEALFPGSGEAKLLLSLATFGVGFVTRPLGGLVIGRFADRKGRKPAMILSFSMMGIAIVGLSLTPSYALIGMAAPILAVLFRMLQGFALGGEVGPNTAFLVEAAPPDRRSFYVSLQFATQNFSIVVAGCGGLLLSSTLSNSALVGWGWRAAFLIGALIVPFTIAIRKGLAETLVREEEPIRSGPSRRTIIIVGIAGLLLLAGATIGTYTVDYITTFAQRSLGMDARTAFMATVLLGITMTFFNLVSGRLGDRYGRKPVALFGWLLLLFLSIPAFLIMIHFRNALALFSMTILLALLMGILTPPSVTLFTEALPARVRAGALGTVYAVSIAVFGGSAQFIEQLLINRTGSPIAPAFYMTAAIGIGMIGIFMLEETGRPAREADVPVISPAAI
ncbi:MAG TPA: MFS transporter [Sphingomicrobium sp.]|jgi:MFS family permease|nr:MFS transporter [Sphingomicrobium sp.]